MADPLISVIVPTYGRPEYLAEALESIKAQSYTRWEAIVVDDASPEPVQVPEWVTLVRHRRNMGPGAARNTGLAHANGELVTFLDDDDWFHPNRLQWAVDEIGDARTHACLTASGAGAALGSSFDGDLRRTFHHSAPPCMGQCVHRIEDVVQFDPALRGSEDWEWWARMGHAAVFACHREVGHFYRQHNGDRNGYDHRRKLVCRRQTYARHVATLDRRGRANFASRVATGHWWCGHRVRTAWWAARAFVNRPTVLSAKLIGRGLLG